MVRTLMKTVVLFIALTLLIPYLQLARAETIPIPGKRPDFSKHQLHKYNHAQAPVPSRKPAIESKDKSEEKSSSNKSKIISFAMRSDQIDLDSALEQFLMDHVIKLSEDNPTLNIEIQAYATAEDKQEHSDMRRSLARGLEVRRFLISQGIVPNRLTLSAMGQDKNNRSDNRIDLLFTAPQ